MGAVPSRETHRRGLYVIPQGPAAGFGASTKKQEVVLIPLTKEHFPSPDCPLFVQFHRARCDAAVNYYFRQPGNPGDLSQIPNYAKSYRPPGAARGRARRATLDQQQSAGDGTPLHSDMAAAPHSNHEECNDSRSLCSASLCEEEEEEEEDPYPSREALYRGVVEQVEEFLFDTDAEMREAYAYSCANPQATTGPNGTKRRKVLPVLCAVAFRYDRTKLGHVPSAAVAADGTPANHSFPLLAGAGPMHNAYHAAAENGIFMDGSIINIVGCFGFVSMEPEVATAIQLQQQSLGDASNNEGVTSQRVFQDAYVSPVGGVCTTLGSFTAAATAAPPPVAAPLSALVFLTKSAGEQNLGRVTCIAAGTYYHQLLEAGVIQRRSKGHPTSHSGAAVPPQQPLNSTGPAPMPPGSLHLGDYQPSQPCASSSPRSYPGCQGGSPTYPTTPLTSSMPALCLPPMETFSFSSLLTNIPILSFLYEMKCRWGYLGVLRTPAPTTTGCGNRPSNCGARASPEPTMPPTPLSPFRCPSMSSSLTVGDFPQVQCQPRTGVTHSAGGLANVDQSQGQDITDQMEMWISADHMIHGRISKDLAARLCWSLAVRPEVMQERVAQLPSEEDGYWRYRGLVDRTRPPPVPCPGRITSIHPKDVYVMGSDVLQGFDEGDILRFDPNRLVWFADHSIPLEGVVLAAMRPYCKLAREAKVTDEGWVTVLRPAHKHEGSRHDQSTSLPLPPPTPTQEAALAQAAAEGRRLRRTHEHVGPFYVHRFVRDGVTYHHGTVPDFANPNKNRNFLSASLSSAARRTPEPQPSAEPTTVDAAAVERHSTTVHRAFVAVPNGIASALFTLLPASYRQPGTPEADEHCGSRQQGGTLPATNPNASSTTAPSYLPSRVTSTAVETARRLMRSLYSYAYGAPTRSSGGNQSNLSHDAVQHPPMGNTHGMTPVTIGGTHVGTPLHSMTQFVRVGTPQYPVQHCGPVWPLSPIVSPTIRSCTNAQSNHCRNYCHHFPPQDESGFPAYAGVSTNHHGYTNGVEGAGDPQLKAIDAPLPRSSQNYPQVPTIFAGNHRKAHHVCVLSLGAGGTAVGAHTQSPGPPPHRLPTPAEPGSPAGAHRARRYVEGGNYVWDWRQSLSLAETSCPAPSTLPMRGA